jgi:polysaccharide export outer membrane protein
VEQDGTIRFPFVGKEQVAGLTVSELEEELTKDLKSSGIVQEPQVVVSVVLQPWAIVTISGDVQKPGVFPAHGQLRLMDYLSQAGGIQSNLLGGGEVTNSSASSTVTLIRPSLDKPVSISLGPDPANSPYSRIPLLPGDEVRVGRVGLVYAVGAFPHQGAFPLKNNAPTTVLQLMAMAGGIGFEGDRRDAHIIRTEGELRYIIDVNVSRILGGKTADVALKPDDILFVPTDQMKAAIKGAGSALLVSIATAATYAYR